MRTSFIASALSTFLLVASAVNAAPVAEPQYEVEVIIERDADLPVHLIEKRQVIVTVTRTAHEQQFQYGQRTRTITRTIRRTRAQTSVTPIATPDNTPAEVFVTPDTTPTPTPANTPVKQKQQAQPKTTSTPSSDTTSSSAVGPDANAQSALDTHNKYRALHGVGALTWDDTLASYAAQHAAGCVFQHTGGPYGENLAAGYGSISASIDAWYNEINQYNFQSGGFSSATGHATQVLWKGSSKLGCAWVSCNTASTPGQYLMCEYSAAGNVIGQFQENVFPATS